MSNKLSTLLSYDNFKHFLIEYHKVLTKEFNFNPLGIGKALIAVSKVWGYDKKDAMVSEIQSNPHLLTARKEIITIVSTEKVDDYNQNNTIYNCFDWDEVDLKLKDLWESEIFNHDIDKDELYDHYDFDEEEKEDTDHYDGEELVQHLKETRTGKELSSKMESISHGYSDIEIHSDYINIQVNISDII